MGHAGAAQISYGGQRSRYTTSEAVQAAAEAVRHEKAWIWYSETGVGENRRQTSL